MLNRNTIFLALGLICATPLTAMSAGQEPTTIQS